MSHDEAGKPRPPVPLATIERLADRYEREEMERLLAATDEELDAELKEEGFAPDDAANLMKAALEKSAAPARAPAEVVSLAAARERRGRRVGWLALVAAAAAVVVLGGGGVAIVALRTPEPAPPPTTTEPTPPRPPPEVLARQDADVLRRQAATECAAKAWGSCAGDLATAAKLDPAGDEARSVRRLEAKAGRALDAAAIEAKPGTLMARSLAADDGQSLVDALAPLRGQPARVVCSRGSEPEGYCRQLAAAMTKAGWVVTREVAARDAGAVYGLAITVTEGSDDATEDAGEALAEGLDRAGVRARGPDDAPAAAGAATGVTLTVGER